MAGNKVYVQGSYVDVHDNEVVNLTIDKAGTVNVQDAKGNGESRCAAVSDESGEVPALPELLATDTAMRYWAGLQACGFVDDDCRLLKTTTRKQAMYIADLFADALQLHSKWKLFERFWGIRNLAQEKWEMQENGKMPNRYDEIDKIFEE